MDEHFKGCSIQSDEQVDETIDSEEHVDARNWLRNDSAEQVGVTNDSEKLVVDGSDPKSDPSIATDTTNGISDTDTTNRISTQKLHPLFIKPAIQAVVQPIETRSRASLRSPNLVAISISPAQFRDQDIINSRHPGGIIKEDGNAEPFDAHINGNSTKNSEPTTFFSHVVGLKVASGEVADVDLIETMNFASNPVLGKNPKFVDLRLSTSHTGDKLKSVIGPATRAGGLTDNSDRFTSSHGISKVAADRVREAKAYSDYIKNSEFETIKVF